MSDSFDHNHNPDSNEPDPLRMKNVCAFAKFSFELEEKRRQSFLEQSGRMFTAFSITSAALLLSVQILLPIFDNLKYEILISAGVVLSFLLGSMVLAGFSQWRYKYMTLKNGKEILDELPRMEEERGIIFDSQARFDKLWIEVLGDMQESHKKNNDGRGRLIRWSMFVFLVAIGALILCSFVICFCH